MNPIFPGNYEWAPGVGGGEGGLTVGDGYTRGRCAHFSTKDLFSIPRGVVRYQLLSLKQSAPSSWLPTVAFSPSLSLSVARSLSPAPEEEGGWLKPVPLSFLFVPVFSVQRALFMRQLRRSVYFRENRPRGEERARDEDEERGASEKKGKRAWRLGSARLGCGDLFLAT